MLDRLIYKLLELVDRFSNSKPALITFAVLLILISYTIT